MIRGGEQLYREWFALGVIEDRAEWKKKELDSLQNQRFHTSFGLTNRQPRLNKRIDLILANKKTSLLLSYVSFVN